MSVAEKRVPSPCINTCQLNRDDVCEGCFRSLKEIGDWIELTNAQRVEVLLRCNERRKHYGLVL